MMNLNENNYLNSRQKLLRKKVSQFLQANNSPLYYSNCASISVRTTDDTSLIAPLEIKICMHQGAYRGAHFEFYVELLEDYPAREANVEIWARQPIWHPTIVQKTGRVSLTMKCKDLVAVVMAIRGILYDPAIEPVINVMASSTLNKSREHFDMIVSHTLDGATVNDVCYPSMRNLYRPNCVVPQSYNSSCSSSDHYYFKNSPAPASEMVSCSAGNYRETTESLPAMPVIPHHNSFTKFFDSNCNVNKRTIIERDSSAIFSRNPLHASAIPWGSISKDGSNIWMSGTGTVDDMEDPLSKESKCDELSYGCYDRSKNRNKLIRINI